MAMTAWTFDGYTFPVDSQPERGGAGEWNYEEKAVYQSPLNGTTDIITSFGFKSSRRTIRGRCNQAMRDAMRGKQTSRVTGLLTDADGGSVSARIEKATFKELFPGGRYSYDILFCAR